MNDAVIETVAQHVSDMLGAGAVGLYLVMWELNGDPPSVPRAESVAHARAALHRVLLTEDVVLVWLLWSDMSYERDAEVSALDDPHVWDDPTDQPYLAVMPRADRGLRTALKDEKLSRLKRIFGGKAPR